MRNGLRGATPRRLRPLAKAELQLHQVRPDHDPSQRERGKKKRWTGLLAEGKRPCQAPPSPVQLLVRQTQHARHVERPSWAPQDGHAPRLPTTRTFLNNGTRVTEGNQLHDKVVLSMPTSRLLLTWALGFRLPCP